MKKGFIHMIEIVLVSLIVIMSIPVILYPFSRPSEWDKVLLYTHGKDFISTADKINENGESFVQNLMEKNKTEISNELWRIMGIESRKINYGIHTRGSIKNKIRVAFNCTTCDVTSEKIYIRSMLSPAYVNGRFVNFELFTFSYDDMDKYDIDVIVLTNNDPNDDTITQAESHIDKIKNHLKNGGGIIEIVDSGSIANTNLQTDIFGISAGSGGSGGNITFNNPDDPKKPNYEIQKYFYGVGIYTELNSEEKGNFTLWKGEKYKTRGNNTGCLGSAYCKVDVDRNGNGIFESNELGFEEGDIFSIKHNLKNFNFSVDKIDKDGKYVSFNFLRDEPYEFEDFTEDKINTLGSSDRIILETSGGRPAGILNQTSGRAVWIDAGNGDDVGALVKSAVIWAAGKDWWNILKTISGEYEKVSYFVSQGEDFHEPYWIEFNVWYIY